MTSLPPSTPILVGIGVTQQKCPDAAHAASNGKEAYQLMAEAAGIASKDSGSKEVLTNCQLISCPKGMWEYTDPSRLVAESIGAHGAQTLLAEIGIPQQTLFADVCQKIQQGEISIGMVIGGEAKYRQLQGTIAGIEIPETAQEQAPDITLKPDAELWLESETNAGLGMPVGYYAIMESAYRQHKNIEIEAHREQISQMYSRFSDVAAANPNAWNRTPLSSDDIKNAGGKNKMLAFPYTKKHNSSWNVDQASALIFCSVEKAQELGIPEEKWIFPFVSSESHNILAVSQRPSLHDLPGAQFCAQAIFDHSGLTIEDIQLIDLYSCFPVAVETYADALGLPLDRDLTVTGGMAFAGGPLNNYAMQSTCAIIEKLRQQKGYALTSSVSGMLTKQAFGLWSSEYQKPFVFEDVTEKVKAASPPKTVLDSFEGEVTITGYTVLFQGDAPERLVAIADTPSGERIPLYSQDIQLAMQGMNQELCGKKARVTAPNIIQEIL